MAFKEVDLATEKPELRSVLILGVEKSGKTTFCGTAPKPMLHYCFDGEGYKRMSGIPGIRCVIVDGPNAVSEFEREINSLLITPKKYKWPDGREEVYKTICFDPYSFFSDAVYEEEERKTSDGFKVYGNIMKNHKNFLGQVKKLSKMYNVVVTCHVEIKQDDTTGNKMMMADLNGKTRNSIGAHFDGVVFTKVIPRGNKAEYKICPVPSAICKAGIRIPMGCEDMFGDVEVNDFTALKAKFDAGLLKMMSQTVSANPAA